MVRLVVAGIIYSLSNESHDYLKEGVLNFATQIPHLFSRLGNILGKGVNSPTLIPVRNYTNEYWSKWVRE